MDIETIFGDGGLIARRVPGYRYSRQHVEMAYAVADALHAPHHLAVEAQPGVARSLAYLLPAIQRSDTGAGRGIICTRTRTLRRRILEHDIPLLQAALPTEFSATELEARHHYVGLRRLDDVSGRRDLLFSHAGDVADLSDIQDWARDTTDGRLSGRPQPPGLSLWDRIKSEHGNCMAHRCPRFDDCFYQAARRRAHNAQLVVVSQALLLDDVAMRRRCGACLLPDYDFVVVDEAHALHDTATEHFGVKLSDRQVALLMDTLYDPRHGRGFLAACHAEGALEAVARVRQAARILFSGLRAWQLLHGQVNGRCPQPPAVDNPLSPALRELQVRLGLLRDQLSREQDLFELTSHMDSCITLADLLEELLGQEREAHAYWIAVEDDGSDGHVALHAVPLDVAAELTDGLFRSVGTVILASSSLSLDPDDANFDYARRRLGISGGYSLRLEATRQEGCPPDVLIEAHLPLPDFKVEFVDAACRCIARHASEDHGGMLVVTPDWPALQAVARHLRRQDPALDIAILGRDEAAARGGTTLVTEHMLDEVEPLTPSWQTVIVVRLPFDPFDAPLTEARVDAIHSSGGHAFREYQLPDAILRFKQSVRSAFHTTPQPARIVVLDHRIVTRSYGRKFLSALGACRPRVRRRPDGRFENWNSSRIDEDPAGVEVRPSGAERLASRG